MKESRFQYVVREQVWRLRRTVGEEQAKIEVLEPNTNTMYSIDDDEKDWVPQCACATTYDVYTLGMLHEELRMMGLTNYKLKTMGACEVLLEFESKEEMEITFVEARSALKDVY